MNITYHLSIELPKNKILGRIHHSCLNNEIQQLIINNNEKQDTYLIDFNGYYQFIYLKSGNRIDVQLK